MQSFQARTPVSPSSIIASLRNVKKLFAAIQAYPATLNRVKGTRNTSRLVTVNILARNLSNDELRRQKPIDSRFLVRRNKQKYSPAPSPVPLQIRITQENLRR